MTYNLTESSSSRAASAIFASHCEVHSQGLPSAFVNIVGVVEIAVCVVVVVEIEEVEIVVVSVVVPVVVVLLVEVVVVVVVEVDSDDVV